MGKAKKPTAPKKNKARGKRLLALRDQTGLGQQAFGRKIGIGRSGTISDWETGTVRPQRSNILELARFFRVPFGKMETYIDKGTPLEPQKPEKPHQNGDGGESLLLGHIPLLSSVPANWGQERLAAVHHEAQNWIDRGDIMDRDAFALIVEGDSMEPELRDGSIIVCAGHTEIGDGDLAFVQFGPDRNDENCVRHVYDREDRLLLVPANRAYKPIEVRKAEVVRMCRVIEARRKY